MIRAYRKEEDVGRLLPVIRNWLNECQANDFGIIVSVEDYMDEIYSLIHLEDADLLVMEFKNDIIGIMGIIAYSSPLGGQKIANAHYWYTLPEHRGKGISFLREARGWAIKQDCSHLILNASNIASSMHDKVCRIFEGMGLKKFETSYILKLTQREGN